MGIQICANKGPSPIWGPIMGNIRGKLYKNLLLMNHCPECILGARRFKFAQIKTLGSCMAPPLGLKLI